MLIVNCLELPCRLLQFCCDLLLAAAFAMGKIADGCTRRKSAFTKEKPYGGENDLSHTRKHFKEHAKPLEVKIGDNGFLCEVKEFSTGSLGWYLNGKMVINMGGTPVSVQIGLNLTVVGSKELPKDGDKAESQ